LGGGVVAEFHGLRQREQDTLGLIDPQIVLDRVLWNLRCLFYQPAQGGQLNGGIRTSFGLSGNHSAISYIGKIAGERWY
jgi:hypothetical protein